MLIQFEEYLTFENIYMWVNFGILPFWLLLIVIPNSKITQFFVNSIILPLILSTAYVYIVYQAILLDEPLFDIFKSCSDTIKFSLSAFSSTLLLYASFNACKIV